LLLAGLLLAGCGDDGDDEEAGASTGPPTSTTATPADRPTTTTTTAAVDPEPPGAPCPDPFAGSSPATFDDAGGQYAAMIGAVAPDAGTIAFDVVQWLVGDEADEAYEAETGDSSGVPNDYYLRNESDEVRSATLAPDAEIRLLDRAGDDVTATNPGTVDELGALDLLNPFWLTFADGAIVGVCEQYVP
jgi:hypothetical protein